MMMSANPWFVGGICNVVKRPHFHHRRHLTTHSVALAGMSIPEFPEMTSES
jgi:hypothetical protein